MNLQEIELSELELKDIGRWPLPMRIALLVIAGTGIFFLGFFLDLDDEAAKLNNIIIKREKLQEEYTQMAIRVANLNAYQEQVITLQNNLAKLTQQLPQNNNEAGLLEDITQEAQRSNLQIRSIKPINEEQRDFYVVETIELSLVGNYHGFGDFVSNISMMPRIITLHDFTIKPVLNDKNLSKSANALEMMVTLKTYWAKAGGKKT